MRKLPALGCALALVVLVAAGCSSGGSDAKADKDGGTTTSTSPKAGDRTTTTKAGGSGKGDGSGSGSKSDEAAYVAAVAKNLEKSGVSLDAKAARCAGTKWVDILGVERFTKADVAPKDIPEPDFQYATLKLTRAEALKMIGAFDACGAAPVDIVIAGVGTDLNATQKACIVKNLEPELATEVLARALQGIDLTAKQQQLLYGLDPLCKLGQRGG